MRSRRLVSVLFILCALVACYAFAAGAEQPANVKPEAAADGDVIIYELVGDEVFPVYSALMGVGEERVFLGGVVSGDVAVPMPLENLRWTTNRWDVARIAGQTRESDVIRGSHVTVEARGEGDATLKAELDDGSAWATCAIYVQNSPVPVEEVRINKEEISILDGYTDVLTASVMPPHADFRHLTWHSSNPEIVDIDPTTRTGNRVRLLTAGLQPGTAYISAVSNYSGGRGEVRQSATCTVHHTVEGPRSVEGGCNAGGSFAAAGLLLAVPLLFFLRR